MPGPQSRATIRVSRSIQSTSCLLWGRVKPSSTKRLVARSNSRTVTASSPPSESDSRQRVSAGRWQVAPFQTQLAPCDAESASRSSTVRHSGEGAT